MGEIIRDYEMVVLYHPDLEIDLEKPLSKIEKIIKDQNGEITKLDNWGKRKLTYEIKKQSHAIYVYYELKLPAQQLAKIEGVLNITNEVLRYLITLPVPEAPVDDKKSDSKGGDKKKEESSEDKTASKED